MNMVTIWLAIIIISIIIEVITVDLVSVWFSLGAIVALIGELLGLDSTIQIAIFIIVSIVAIIFTRPLAKKQLHGNVEKTNYDRIIGKHGLVTKTISADDKGEVKVQSTLWSASSYDNNTINEGEYCEILAIEGNHLIVKHVDE